MDEGNELVGSIVLEALDFDLETVGSIPQT